ncbi:RHS repeat-associated core domain-containing protein [Actinomadura napierensis]
MTYNAANQMTQTKVGNTTTGHTYAGPDQTELVKTGTTSIVYGTATTPVAYTTGGATTYIERDDSGIPLAANVGGTDTAYATDGLGSIVATVNIAGAKATGYTYTPYGEQSGKAVGDKNLLGYTGALSDPATTSLYLSHRYYAPGQGSFTQQDTITELADPKAGNRYTYAADNPTNYTDPAGQSWITEGFDAFFGGTGAAEAVEAGDIGTAALGTLTDIGVDTACNFALGLAAPETAGASLAIGEVGCMALGSEAGSAVMSD